MSVENLPATQANELPAVAEENAGGQLGFFGSLKTMGRALKIAEVISKSNIIPDNFKGKPGDVMIALDMAARLDLNLLSVMQSIYIVHGRPAWSGAFYAALITAGGRFRSFRYVEADTQEPVKEIGRNNRTCYIVAVDNDGNEHTGPEVDYKMAVKEGWTSRNGSKWQTMPVLMLRYRAAAFFVRTCCPEAAMGLRERGEEEDIGPIVVKAETPAGALADAAREKVEAEVLEDAPAPVKGGYGPEMAAAMRAAIGKAQTVADIDRIEARIKARTDMPDADRAAIMAELKQRAEMVLAFEA